MSHLPDPPHTPPTLADHTPAPATGPDTAVDPSPTAAEAPVSASSAPHRTTSPEAPLGDMNGDAEAPPSGRADLADVAKVAAMAEPGDSAEGVESITPAAADAATATAASAVTADLGQVPPRVPDLSPAVCAELLKQHFPALFTGPPKPLKLRIQQDIQQRVPGVFSKGSLGAFFRRYTGSTGYLIALGKSGHRFDLDGQPAGELSEEHRNLAREELTRRRQLGRERDQAAQAHQQAAQAEVLQARQARLSLLRDFERTTLTLANFCALKGLTPETLTPQLDQARREAAEAPPPRPVDDRRGPPGPRRDDRDNPRNGPRTDGRRDARPPRMDRASPAGEARGNPGAAPRDPGRPDNRAADSRPGNRPDNRPQAPRPAGRPGGRPGGR